MYRRLFLSVFHTRNRAIHAKKTCVLSTKCDIATLPIFRDANRGGVRALGTTSTTYCENKVPPGREDIKDEAKNGGELREAASVGEEKGFEPHEHVSTTVESVEPIVEVNTDGENVSHLQRYDVNTDGLKQAAKNEETTKTEEKEQRLNVKFEGDESGHPSFQQLKVEGEQEREKPLKTGKEGLLDLLGTMKVEVSSKKRAKALKVQTHSYESVARPNPAAMESTISMFQRATADDPVQSETLSPELVAAASAAASTLPNQSQAESELLRQLRQHEAVTDVQKKGDVNDIGVIIADMKVGKRPIGRENTRPSNQIRFDEDGRGYTHDRGITAELDGVRRRKNLFSGKRLNIFARSTEQDVASTNIAPPTLWDIELANEIALSTTQMPRNGFEEMIQWTKEGKLWQYPINNEAGLEEESSVPFHEHVFLEKHLEQGFPRQGPVRHFMELVVAGLAKNPYLTVLQKKEHIAWFREYFRQKEDVLKEAEVYLN